MLKLIGVSWHHTPAAPQATTYPLLSSVLLPRRIEEPANMETNTPQEMDPNVLKDIVKTLHRLEARLEHQATRLNSIDHSVRSSVSRTGSAILNTTTKIPSVEKLAAEYRDTITRLWDRFDFVNDSHSELRFNLVSRAATRQNTTSFSTAAAVAVAVGDAGDATRATVCASPVDMELDEDDEGKGEDGNNRRPSLSIYSSSRGQSRSRVLLNFAATAAAASHTLPPSTPDHNLPLHRKEEPINKNKPLPPDPPPSKITPLAVCYEHPSPSRLTLSREAATATRLMIHTTSTGDGSGSGSKSIARMNDNAKRKKKKNIIVAIMEKWINTPEGVKDSLKARFKSTPARLRNCGRAPPPPSRPSRPSSPYASPASSRPLSVSCRFSGDVNVNVTQVKQKQKQEQQRQRQRQQQGQSNYRRAMVGTAQAVVDTFTVAFSIPRRFVCWVGARMVSQQLKGFDRGRY